MVVPYGFGRVPDGNPNIYAPPVAFDRRDTKNLLREVEAGLPNEAKRLRIAQKNCDFFDGNMENYVQYADAEQVYDHQFRPKRYSMLTRSAIEYLCMHLYSQGPQRRLTRAPAAVGDWLEEVYIANHIDALMQEADQLSCLNDVACFQVAAVGGPGDSFTGNHGTEDEADDFEAEDEEGYGYDLGIESPIKIHLLGGEEFAVWCEPGDPLRPWAVCTICRYDEQTRFQLWTKDEYWTFYTKQLDPRQTTGGRIARIKEEESGENPYGILPFSFVFAKMPTRDFWVHGPGTGLRKANHWLINSLSDMANAIRYHIRPMAWATDVRPDWRPVIRPGSVTHLPAAPQATSAGRRPELGYLQMEFEIEAVLKECDAFVDRTLQEHQIPPAVFRLDVNAQTSGAAILYRHAPLISRAKARQRPFGRYEADLAKVILCVGGSYYRKQDLWNAGYNARLQLTWPEIEIPLPGTDKDAADQWELDQGITSRVEVLMRRRGLTRDQAISHLKQIEEDNRLLEGMGLTATAISGAANQPALVGVDGQPQLGAPSANGEPAKVAIMDEETGVS